jgi:hypothetical protein
MITLVPGRWYGGEETAKYAVKTEDEVKRIKDCFYFSVIICGIAIGWVIDKLTGLLIRVFRT